MCHGGACVPPPILPCTRYYPMYTTALNSSVKGNRALLLLLPHDVIDSVKVRVHARPGGLTPKRTLLSEYTV